MLFHLDKFVLWLLKLWTATGVSGEDWAPAHRPVEEAPRAGPVHVTTLPRQVVAWTVLGFPPRVAPATLKHVVSNLFSSM